MTKRIHTRVGKTLVIVAAVANGRCYVATRTDTWSAFYANSVKDALNLVAIDVLMEG